MIVTVTLISTLCFASIQAQFNDGCVAVSCQRPVGSLDNFDLCQGTSPAVSEAKCLTEGLKKQLSNKCSRGSLDPSAFNNIQSGTNAANQALGAVNQGTGIVGRGKSLPELWGIGRRKKRLSLPGIEKGSSKPIQGVKSAECLVPDDIPRGDRIDAFEQYQVFDSQLGANVECQIKQCYAKQKCAKETCPPEVLNQLMPNGANFFASLTDDLGGETNPSSLRPIGCNCELQAQLVYCNEIETRLKDANCRACGLYYVLTNQERAVDVCNCFDYEGIDENVDNVQKAVESVVGAAAVNEIVEQGTLPCTLHSCTKEVQPRIDEEFCRQIL